MTKQQLGTLQPGAKVRYSPSYGDEERGIIKNFSEDEKHAFVVYHCGGNWNDYKNYTAARTNHSDLKRGWTN